MIQLPQQQGLVAWYPFDGNASDMSGNGNDGIVLWCNLSAQWKIMQVDDKMFSFHP